MAARQRPQHGRLRGDRRLTAVLRQLAWALATLLAISILTFLGTSLKSPEEVAKASLGREVSAAQVDAFVKRHDLDAPLPERYVRWLGGVVHGDFGRSVLDDRPVHEEVLPRLARTTILATVALLIALPIGLSLGVFAARRWASRTDLGINVGAVTLSALPEFVTGLGLIMIFGVILDVLPVSSSVGIAFGSFTTQVKAFVLPAVTLALAGAPFIFRNARVAAHEALAAPYTRSAVLRGLPRRRVIWSHAMRNAAIPILNATAITMMYLLGGVIVVENVFGFPGVGAALVTAVGNGDTITVQAIALLMGAVFIAISLATDMLAVLFDPRLKGDAR